MNNQCGVTLVVTAKINYDFQYLLTSLLSMALKVLLQFHRLPYHQKYGLTEYYLSHIV